jgi:hypothetical protein
MWRGISVAYLRRDVRIAKMGDPEYSGKWQDMGGGWQVMFNSTDHIGIFYLRRLNKRERRERKAHESRAGKGTWGKGCSETCCSSQGVQ